MDQVIFPLPSSSKHSQDSKHVLSGDSDIDPSTLKSDQGTYTPVGAQGGGRVPRDPTVEKHFSSRILQ